MHISGKSFSCRICLDYFDPDSVRHLCILAYLLSFRHINYLLQFRQIIHVLENRFQSCSNSVFLNRSLRIWKITTQTAKCIPDEFWARGEVQDFRAINPRFLGLVCTLLQAILFSIFNAGSFIFKILFFLDTAKHDIWTFYNFGIWDHKKFSFSLCLKTWGSPEADCFCICACA